MLPLNKSLTGGPKTIVIVDDSLDLAEVYQQVLELEGFSVLLAGSGLQALDLLSKIPPPDLLFVDYAMPVMSGVDFLLELKKNNASTFKNTPIIGLSGFAIESPMLKEMSQLVSRIVEKPDNITDFLKLVKETIPLK